MGEDDAEVRRVFVDTAWKRKFHTCYDPLTDKFFEVDEVKELLQRVRRKIVDKGFKLMPWLSRVSKELGLERRLERLNRAGWANDLHGASILS